MAVRKGRAAARVAVVAGLLLLAAGCGKRSGFAGDWEGDLIERGKKIRVGLSLDAHGGRITGKFTVLRLPSRGYTDDVSEGQSFDIVEVEANGDRLEFVLPVFPDDREDWVKFELRLEGDRLVGTGREMREGSDPLPVTFVRK